MVILASTLALAGVGLTLAHAALFARPVPSPPRRWTPMDLLIQAAGWAVLLLAAALETRRHLAPPVEHEHALTRAMHAEADHRLDTYREDRRG